MAITFFCFFSFSFFFFFLQNCQTNSDVVDRYRRLLQFWSAGKCAVFHVTHHVMYVVMILGIGASMELHNIGDDSQSNIFYPHDSHPNQLLLVGVLLPREKGLAVS